MNGCIITNGEGWAGVNAAVEAFRAGRPPLDVVECGIRAVEADPRVRSVGYGGWPNMLGEMEFDAAVMCGDTLRTGAVGALKGIVHAVSVARQVMERTAHVFLVGEGAVRFAEEIGEAAADVLYPDSRRDYDAWARRNLPEGFTPDRRDIPLAPLTWKAMDPEKTNDTTTWIAAAPDGNMAGGTSTCGWRYKHPGRLGDSPVIGAGLYVDSRYGGAMCTHTGEMAVRAGTARAIVAYMKMGAAVRDACQEAVDDLRALRGGCRGPLVIYAVDRHANPCVLSTVQGAAYWFWTPDMPEAERRLADVVTL